MPIRTELNDVIQISISVNALVNTYTNSTELLMTKKECTIKKKNFSDNVISFSSKRNLSNENISILFS